MEDEDCLIETLNDIRELCAQHGEVTDIVAKGTGVKVTFRADAAGADLALKNLDGLILGGNVVEASIVAGGENHVILHNALTEDDLEDEECLEESLNDIRELASKYGVVINLEVVKSEDTASIRILYEGLWAAAFP